MIFFVRWCHQVTLPRVPYYLEIKMQQGQYRFEEIADLELSINGAPGRDVKCILLVCYFLSKFEKNVISLDVRGTYFHTVLPTDSNTQTVLA